MHISKHNKTLLVEEINQAAELMSQTNNIQEKIYYFSAVFGIAHRIMNIEFDPELGFIHHVTNNAYNIINSTLALMSQGHSLPTFPPEFFDKIQSLLTDLASYINDGKHTYPILENISNLAYSATGNGYYLYKKGSLKL
jgi:hypothetical protein